MRMIQKILLGVALVGALTWLAPETAQARYYLYTRQGSIDLGMGAGITANPPVKFDVQFAGEYFWRNNISFGAAFDVLIRSPHLFLITPFARYHFDIADLPKLVPYVGGGVGAGANTNGNGVMNVLVPNFGFKYSLTRHIKLGTDLGFHILTNFDNTQVDFHVLFAVVTFRF